ncbi:MAG: hypothetical protein NT111_03455 [Patescibacteria group bacterium]|nr:hypothetical protein [Patescibacteria group bacterium]
MFEIFSSYNEPVEAFHHEYCERFSPKTLRAALEEGTRDGAMLQLSAGDSLVSTKVEYQEVLLRAVSAYNEANLLNNFAKAVEFAVEGHNGPLDRRPMAGWPRHLNGALFSPDELFSHSENAFMALVYSRAGDYGGVVSEAGYFRDTGAQIFGNKRVIGPTPAQQLCMWLAATSKNSGERRILI